MKNRHHSEYVKLMSTNTVPRQTRLYQRLKEEHQNKLSTPLKERGLRVNIKSLTRKNSNNSELSGLSESDYAQQSGAANTMSQSNTRRGESEAPQFKKQKTEQQAGETKCFRDIPYQSFIDMLMKAKKKRIEDRRRGKPLDEV